MLVFLFFILYTISVVVSFKLIVKPFYKSTVYKAIDDSKPSKNEILDSEILETFPSRHYPLTIDRDYPDFEKLQHDDPLFLDMPWPTERGPESAAFARHIQWKRRLNDGDRLRWQKWAIYQRIMRKDMFKYKVDDYIIQNYMAELQKQFERLKQENQTIDTTLMRAAILGMKSDEVDEIQAVIKSFYTSLNRKNFDGIRTVWLPDDSVQLLLPGYEKARGHFETEKLLRRMVKENKPIGILSPEIISVETYGFVAMAQTVETVLAGAEIKSLRKKGSSPKQSKSPPKKVLSTTVLRKFNEQWRIMLQHSTPLSTSTDPKYGTDLIEVIDTFFRRSSTFSSNSNQLSNRSDNEVERSSLKGRAMSNVELFDSSKDRRANEDANKLWQQVKGFTDGTGVDTKNAPTVITRKKADGTIEKVLSLSENANPLKTAYKAGGVLSDQIKGKEGSMEMNTLEGILMQSFKDALAPGYQLKRAKDGTVLFEPSAGSRNGTGKESLSRSSNSGGDDSTDDFQEKVYSKTLSSVRRDSRGDSTSTSKKTIEALRFLQKSGRLPRDGKNLLLMDIINCACLETKSLVETSFELLMLSHFQGTDEDLYHWRPSDDDEGMDDFAEQCVLLVNKLAHKSRPQERSQDKKNATSAKKIVATQQELDRAKSQSKSSSAYSNSKNELEDRSSQKSNPTASSTINNQVKKLQVRKIGGEVSGSKFEKSKSNLLNGLETNIFDQLEQLIREVDETNEDSVEDSESDGEPSLDSRDEDHDGKLTRS